MDWLAILRFDAPEGLVAVHAAGLVAVLSGVAGAVYFKDRSRRAKKMRLLKGTARDRMDGAAGVAPAQSNGRIKAFVVSLGRSAATQDPASSKTLRAQLRQAGWFGESAFAYFVALRVCLALAAAVGAYVAALASDWPELNPLFAGAAGLAFGYVAPGLALGRRISGLRTEHRNGFPDMMDLLVVCVQAGLSIEAAIQKVGESLSDGFPSLSRHLGITSLELRNGRSLSQAIEALALRLGIDEAASFATLLQQSEQLGASISDSLRAFSDDMRNKRLMRAEEKAYALPSKLVVPLTLFVFPVVLVVLLLPVAVAVSSASA